MQNFKNIVWLTVISIFLSGCSSSYRKATIPQAPQIFEENRDESTVKLNSIVRLELINGEKLAGKVTQVTPDQLMITGDGNYRYSERVILVSDIANIEVEYLTSRDKAQNNGMVIGAVVGLAVVAFLGFVSAMSGMN